MEKIMKKIYWKGWLVLMAFLCPVLSFADVVININPFTVPPTDASLGMLQQIFGWVGNVIPGTAGIFNTMFREFNGAMLILAALVLIYTFFTILLNSARQGEFLGGKLDSMWTIIRLVAGILLVAPLPIIGYSTIQLIMMWVVLQGVGAADQLWNATLDYFKDSPLFNVSLPPNSDQKTATNAPSTDIISDASNVLMNLICRHQLYKMNNPSATTGDDLDLPTAESSVSATGKTIYTYTFAAPPTAKSTTPYIGAACGSIVIDSSNSGVTTDVLKKQKNGFDDAMMGLDPVAKDFVYNHVDPSQHEGGKNAVFLSAKQLALDIQQPPPQPGDNDEWGKNFIQDAKNKGWANAGVYYLAMATKLKDQDLSSAALQGTTVLTLGSTFPPYTPSYLCQSSAANASAGSSDPCNGATAFQSALYQDALVLATGMSDDPSGMLPSMNIGALVGFTTTEFTKLENTITYGLETLFLGIWTDTPFDPETGLFGTSRGVHPIIQIARMGNELCVGMAIWFTVMLVLLVALNILISALPTFIGAWFNVFSLLKLIGFPIAALMGVLYTAGLMMSVYVPLIPFIIFATGVIGWLIAVIETMLAAPMVAIGLTLSGGQDEVLGRAEPALQLLANVFLRPSLMLFGMIAGLLVSYVAVNFVSMLFGSIVASLTQHLGWSGPLGPVQLTLLLVIYIAFVIAILNQSFALIHIFPDRILAWIGWQAQFGQYSQETEKGVRGAFEKGSGAVTQAAGSLASQGTQATAAHLKKGGGKEGGSGPTATPSGGGDSPFDSGAGTYGDESPTQGRTDDN